MPNLDPWINQNEATNKFENDLLSIRDDRQKMIRPNCHPTYNERHEKIIEMIDWTLEIYRANMENAQLNDEQVIIDPIIEELDQKRQVIIDPIIEELDQKRDIAINKKRQALFKDEVWKYGGEEDTIDYVLFRIRELTGKLI